MNQKRYFKIFIGCSLIFLFGIGLNSRMGGPSVWPFFLNVIPFIIVLYIAIKFLEKRLPKSDNEAFVRAIIVGCRLYFSFLAKLQPVTKRRDKNISYNLIIAKIERRLKEYYDLPPFTSSAGTQTAPEKILKEITALFLMGISIASFFSWVDLRYFLHSSGDFIVPFVLLCIISSTVYYSAIEMECK